MDARSLSSQAASSATSRGSAIRPSGVAAALAAMIPGLSASHSFIISVAVPPEGDAVHPDPVGAQVTAAVSVMLFKARFIAPYGRQRKSDLELAGPGDRGRASS